MEHDSLPRYDLPIRREGKDLFVFDFLRKKELVLSPEEYVRQCLVKFLLEEKKVPGGLISLERATHINALAKRYDLVVYGRNGKPILIAECKAPEVALDEKAFRQLSIYNSTVQATFLILTNGHVFLVYQRHENEKFIPLTHLPLFEEW